MRITIDTSLSRSMIHFGADRGYGCRNSTLALYSDPNTLWHFTLTPRQEAGLMPDRITLVLGVVCLLLFLGLHIWQSPGGRGLTASEVDTYLDRVEQQLDLAPSAKPALLRRLRDWAEDDDGKPVHMLNVMRFRDRLMPPAGTEPPAGTPQSINARYEAAAAPLILKRGGYPLLSGSVLGANVVESPPVLDNWDRIAVVRYPNRRAFLEMISDPSYAGLEAQKLMAVELILVPFRTDLKLPDPRWPVGMLLLAVFLATGWWRSSRFQSAGPG